MKIGIQKSGRLRQPALDFLKELGWEGPETDELLAFCPNDVTVQIANGRHSDLPAMVQNGIIDIAIVGQNTLIENDYIFDQLAKLEFGKCKLSIAAPINSVRQIKELQGKRIATSYPRSLKRFLGKIKVTAEVVTLSGSVEIAPALGMADAICDLVQSGKTLETNKLEVISDVYESQAVLIANKNLSTNLLYDLKRRIDNANV
ncbi:ATP phosphoribosyltransferase [Candidatus Saccharibacteria bacterium]|jgi:ATP phosphoribosyltransferase|nr:ATP phosphoribosyltransferase [Candidatus Saccharibacteria bacterium]